MCGKRNNFHSTSLPLSTEKLYILSSGRAEESVQKIAFLFASEEMHDSVNANWHWFSQCKVLPDTLVYRVFKATLGGGAQEWADKSCHSSISIRGTTTLIYTSWRHADKAPTGTLCLIWKRTDHFSIVFWNYHLRSYRREGTVQFCLFWIRLCKTKFLLNLVSFYSPIKRSMVSVRENEWCIILGDQVYFLIFLKQA